MKNKPLISKITLVLVCSSLVLFAKWERAGLEGIEVTAIDMNNSCRPIIGTHGKGIYLLDSNITPFYTGWLDTFELFIRTVHSAYIYTGSMAASPYFAGTDSGLCHYFYMDYDSSSMHKVTVIK